MLQIPLSGKSFYFLIPPINTVSPSFRPQILLGGRRSSDSEREPRGPGCLHVCGKNAGGPRRGLGAAHGVR